MQHSMIFDDFRLIRVDFRLNDKFSGNAEKVDITPEVLIDHKLIEKENSLLVILGVRCIHGDIPYYFEVTGGALFKFDELPEENLLNQLATVNCPAIAFPYLRETVADLTRRAGEEPLHLSPVNFVELAKSMKKKE